MERYDSNNVDGSMSRIKRNQSIYNSSEISDMSRVSTNSNVSIISDAEKEIDLDKIRNYLYNNEERENEKRRISLELPPEEEITVTRQEQKDYDINTVLERARDKREIDYEENKYRKINDSKTQIDILKNIKIREEVIEEDPDITGPINELNTEEQTIVDLIKDIRQNSNKKKELFDDLMGNEEETVVMGMKDDEDELKSALLDITKDLSDSIIPDSDFTREMNEEKENLKKQLSEKGEEKEKDISLDLEELTQSIKNIEESKDDEEESIKEDLSFESTSPKISTIDKSFYTNSMTFNKSDFEGFEDLEKSASTSVFAKIAIVLIIIMLIATIFLILNFVLDWNII